MNDDEAICMIVPNALWNTVRVFSLSILLYGSKSNLLGETIKPILNELKVDSRRGTILYCIQHNSIMCVESEPMIKRANDTEKANRNEGLKITVERKRTKCDRYVPYKLDE